MKFVQLLCLFFALIISSLTHAGSRVGNTADGFVCSSPTQAGEPEQGIYSADYLLTQGTSFSEVQKKNSMREYAAQVAYILGGIDPRIAKDYRDFVALFGNTDYSKRYVWETPSFRLARDRKLFNLNNDSKLSVMEKFEFEDVWTNCKTNDVPNHVIFVIRESHEFSGRPKGRPLFKYNPDYLAELKKNPLQLSMVLTHEWLWNHTDNIRVNRRVNRFLHSQKAARMRQNESREVLVRFLTGMGIKNISAGTPPQKEETKPAPHTTELPTTVKAYAKPFQKERYCPASGQYGESSLRQIISRQRKSLIFNRQQFPAALLSRDTKVLTRTRLCRTEQECSQWVIANDTLLVKDGESLTNRSFLHLAQFGTTHLTFLVGTGNGQNGLACEASRSDLQGSITCGTHPSSNVSFDTIATPLTFRGEWSYECFRVLSDPISTSVGNGPIRREYQSVIFADFTPPLRRVQERRITN